MTSIRCWAGLVAISGALVAASTHIPAELREITADATLIVRGRVTDVRAARQGDGDVQSMVTVAVAAVLKGTADAFVTVRLPGGTLGRYRHVMVGAPTARVGDDAVFFLKRTPGGAWWPVGLTAGIYRVTPASDSGRPVVAAPVVSGVTANASGAVTRGDPRRRPMAVSEFDSLVRLIVASPARTSARSGGSR